MKKIQTKPIKDTCMIEITIDGKSVVLDLGEAKDLNHELADFISTANARMQPLLRCWG